MGVEQIAAPMESLRQKSEKKDDQAFFAICHTRVFVKSVNFFKDGSPGLARRILIVWLLVILKL
jgi:hypothetical protein